MSRPQKPRKLVILGAGAQGQNIHDVCTDLGVEVVGFLDDTKAQGEIVNGVPVLGGFDAMTRPELIAGAEYLVGLGDNVIRRRLSDEIEKHGGKLASVVHPSCFISPSAEIGNAVFISGFSRVMANARIGRNALIEGHCTIGNDCVLEDDVACGPGCMLIHGSRIGKAASLGTGTVVIGPARVGSHSVIGAGATVLTDIPDRVLAVGTPAMVKKDFR